MPYSDKLSELQQMLISTLIRKRKAGIAMAAEMLATDAQSQAVRALLDEIAKNDAMLTMREAAQAALDADQKRRNPPPPEYVFGGRCPNGHVSYYDKREHCPKQGHGTYRTISRDGKDLDEVLLKCKTKDCGEEFFVVVDCDGYK
jgi:hypothetical protein